MVIESQLELVKTETMWLQVVQTTTLRRNVQIKLEHMASVTASDSPINTKAFGENAPRLILDVN